MAPLHIASYTFCDVTVNFTYKIMLTMYQGKSLFVSPAATDYTARTAAGTAESVKFIITTTAAAI